MLVIVGILVVFVSVISGYLVAGGHLILLWQVAEFIIIIGAALGSMIIAAPPVYLKKILAGLKKTLSPSHFTKQDNLELLKSFNDLFLIAQRDGLLAIEKHIENPAESDVLSVNKKFIQNKEITSFFCDTMKVMLSGGVPPHELEAIIDIEIDTFEHENRPASDTLNKVGDSFPGLGIVAAVLGIIVTMGSIDQGATYVGKKVAAALVGTFLGVLIAYGFVNPLATNMAFQLDHEIRFYQTIKTCLVAYAKGNPPIVAVEIARRTIVSGDRPTFQELENYIRGK